MAVPVLAGVLAHLAALSVPAKAALGVGVALGAVAAVPVVEEVTADEVVVDAGSGASGTGAVDDGGQDVGDTPEDGLLADDVPAEPEADVAPDGVDEPDEDGKDLPAASDFGQSVAADARDGGVDGQEIRARAHERNAQRAAERAAERAGDDADDQAAEDGGVPPVAEPEQPADGGTAGDASGDGAEVSEPAAATTSPGPKPGNGRGGGKGPRP